MASKLECLHWSTSQKTGKEPAITSWSAFPIGWPDAPLRLYFCKTVGRESPLLRWRKSKPVEITTSDESGSIHDKDGKEWENNNVKSAVRALVLLIP